MFLLLPAGGQLRALGRAGKEQRSADVYFANVLMCQGRKRELGWELLPLPTATFSIGSSEMQTSKHVFPSALAGITSSLRRVKEKGWRELKP